MLTRDLAAKELHCLGSSAVPTRDSHLRKALQNVVRAVRSKTAQEHAPWELSPIVGEGANEHEAENEPRTPPNGGKRVVAGLMCMSALAACSALTFFVSRHVPTRGDVEGRGLDGCFALQLSEDVDARGEGTGADRCIDRCRDTCRDRCTDQCKGGFEGRRSKRCYICGGKCSDGCVVTCRERNRGQDLGVRHDRTWTTRATLGTGPRRALFRFVAGLDGQPNTTSIQYCRLPKYYIHGFTKGPRGSPVVISLLKWRPAGPYHVYGNIVAKIGPDQVAEFNRSASFIKHDGRFLPGDISFELKTRPNWFVVFDVTMASGFGYNPHDGALLSARAESDLKGENATRASWRLRAVNAGLGFVSTRRKCLDAHGRNEALDTYKDGRGMVYYYHITHDAGTTIRKLSFQNGDSQPGANAIWQAPGDDESESSNLYLDGDSSFVMHERQMNSEDHWNSPCDSNRIVMATAIRHPLTRLLAGDGLVHKYFPERFTRHDLSRFKDSRYADNYQLRWLIGQYTEIGNSPGRRLTRHDLEVGKARLRAFSMVLIVEYFDASTVMLCSMLAYENCRISPVPNDRVQLLRKGVRRRINNDTVYADLLERNALEMELYYYAVDLFFKQLVAQNLTHLLPWLGIDATEPIGL